MKLLPPVLSSAPIRRAALRAYGWPYLAALIRANRWGRGDYWCEPVDRSSVQILHRPEDPNP